MFPSHNELDGRLKKVHSRPPERRRLINLLSRQEESVKQPILNILLSTGGRNCSQDLIVCLLEGDGSPITPQLLNRIRKKLDLEPDLSAA